MTLFELAARLEPIITQFHIQAEHQDDPSVIAAHTTSVIFMAALQEVERGDTKLLHALTDAVSEVAVEWEVQRKLAGVRES